MQPHRSASDRNQIEAEIERIRSLGLDDTPAFDRVQRYGWEPDGRRRQTWVLLLRADVAVSETPVPKAASTPAMITIGQDGILFMLPSSR